MGNLFGRKAKHVSKITQQDKAILQLKQQRDRLRQYQRRIEDELEKHRTLAKQLIQDGKKDRAKLLLRKKRYQEQLLLQTDNQLETLEHMAHDLEFAQIEVKVVEGLKIGNEALKKVNEALNIDDIEQMLEETKEGVEKQQEIDALLSGVLTSEDEEAVLEELDTIIAESLPAVPDDQLANKSEDISEKLPDVPGDTIEVADKPKFKEAIAVEA